MIKGLFIDEILGDRARVIYDEEEFSLPISLLPKGAKEGDMLSISIKLDSESAQKAKKECEDLLAQLLAANAEK